MKLKVYIVAITFMLGSGYTIASQHHDEAKGRESAAALKSDMQRQMETAAQHIAEMRQLLVKVDASHDASERKVLMERHRTLMRTTLNLLKTDNKKIALTDRQGNQREGRLDNEMLQKHEAPNQQIILLDELIEQIRNYEERSACVQQ